MFIVIRKSSIHHGRNSNVWVVSTLLRLRFIFFDVEFPIPSDADDANEYVVKAADLLCVVHLFGPL